jgi:hypothetical protein
MKKMLKNALKEAIKEVFEETAKGVLHYVDNFFVMVGYFFAVAIFGSIAIIAYYFYPIITTIVLALAVIGWVAEFFGRRKSRNS